jgi:predicted alpha/beta-fold hydrolase
MLHGHAWTLRRHLEGSFKPAALPASRLLRVQVPDARFGSVTLSARLSDNDSARELLVLVHGLGGSSQSVYLMECTRQAHALGVATLRLNLRGADRLGHDLFHAGLGEDLDAVLQAPELQRYARRYLLGFSIGGHVCLKYAAYSDAAAQLKTAGPDPAGVVRTRADAIAVVGAPLQLASGAAHFDRGPAWPYRAHVMGGLFEMYEAFVARRGAWPLELSAARKLQRISDFDHAIIAPRFGYRDAQEYYFEQSAARVLRHIETPTLYLAARHDPMVPWESVEPFLNDAPGAVTVLQAERGGHVAFPSDLHLGQPAESGLAAQILSWLRRERRAS